MTTKLNEIKGINKLCSIDCRGKIGRSGGFGLIRLGYNFFGYYSPWSGIYSLKHLKGKKYLSKMKFSRPRPWTDVERDILSNFMKDAWIAYNNLTVEDKMVLSKKARRLKMSGSNLFMKKYLKGKTW